MEWFKTDLGSNVMRASRLLREDRRYALQGPMAYGLPAEHFDGILAASLRADGLPFCTEDLVTQPLFAHQPHRPQACNFPIDH
jgi:hypothetical protein